MKEKLTVLMRLIIGKNRFNRLRNSLNEKILKYYRLKNFISDYHLFEEHSTIQNKDTLSKKETHIILNYHSLEKGFLHDNLKLRFGKIKVIELLELLKDQEVNRHINRSQFKAACLVLKQYFEKHKEMNCDISDYFSEDDYLFVKNNSIGELKPIVENTSKTYFENNDSKFSDFSFSRKSVRHYTGDIIPTTVIQDVIGIARNSPSVCNRQGSRVYLVEDKKKIHKLLEVQGGLAGFFDNINQVLVVTGDRNSYYTIGERNQLFVDGGLFLMNLLYSLHFHKIAACPAHWCYPDSVDEQVRNLIGMKKSEKIICLVTIGIPPEKFNVTLSLRRDAEELLKIV
ncbi:MAG: nitroreductase family protein [Bacteroidota bacterium]